VFEPADVSLIFHLSRLTPPKQSWLTPTQPEPDHANFRSGRTNLPALSLGKLAQTTPYTDMVH
jgi:hypothetical protein